MKVISPPQLLFCIFAPTHPQILGSAQLSYAFYNHLGFPLLFCDFHQNLIWFDLGGILSGKWVSESVEGNMKNSSIASCQLHF